MKEGSGTTSETARGRSKRDHSGGGSWRGEKREERVAVATNGSREEG